MSNEQQAANPDSQPEPTKSSANGWRTFGIVVITMVITLSVGFWAIKTYMFPTEFTPVTLSQKEQQRLDHKLERFERPPAKKQKPTLEPEAYSEVGASREIKLTEKELNALLANNTDLASKLAIDLSDNLASAKLLIDMDPEFPVLGGKTVKVTAGMELKVVNGKPSAILKGVSVWGVPLPNAWLGNMKNTDLIQEFGQAGGLWQAINEGVEVIEVKEGQLYIKLKE